MEEKNLEAAKMLLLSSLLFLAEASSLDAEQVAILLIFLLPVLCFFSVLLQLFLSIILSIIRLALIIIWPISLLFKGSDKKEDK